MVIEDWMLRLCSLEASKLARYHKLEFEELKAQAMLGLVELIPRHDPTRSKMKTYLGKKLKYYLLDYIRKESWIPRLEQRKIKAGLVEPPRIGSLGVIQGSPNIENPFRQEEYDPPEQRDYQQEADNRDAVNRILKKLRPRERLIFRLYWLEDFTMQDIGKAVGLSESRVSQMISGALKFLKENVDATETSLGTLPATSGCEQVATCAC